SSVSEIAFARELGLDVIICDHHEEPKELPSGVVAFLNPHLQGETYPFKGLSGCGVVFKLCQALWKSFELPEGREKWFLDLAAISTVADMMDLVGENRIITAYGLKVLNKTRRKGLQALMSDMRAGPHGIGTYEIGFVIAPRLNAAGRIDHANTAYELLTTEDAEEAKAIAHSLNATNGERQSQTARIVKEAKEQVASQLADRKVLVAFGKDWSPGVVGLVSGRLTEQYYRPSLVITKSEKGIVGSGRSIPGFNITEALSHASQYLERFGGHDGACGFTVKSEEDIDAFADALNRIADEKFSDEDLVKSLAIDMELSLELVDWDFVRALEQMEPYGMGNPMPKFVSR
ncbi:MAG: DHHA1 domain-containing protein, partial [Patescibacteria group bacterium]|nr:DHHA1 domain-containing protein [Patescibacteria group bacterium]